MKKILTATVLTVGLTAATAAPALAQDCFNASRSGTGNAQAAAGSGRWWSLPELLADLGGLDQQQIDAVMVVVQGDSRIPTGFTVFYNPAHPGELASKLDPTRATDGRGIDHSDDYSTRVFAALFEDVAVALS